MLFIYTGSHMQLCPQLPILPSHHLRRKLPHCAFCANRLTCFCPTSSDDAQVRLLRIAFFIPMLSGRRDARQQRRLVDSFANGDEAVDEGKN